MRVISYKLLLVTTLAMILGVSSAFANPEKDKKKDNYKRPKDMGVLTVKTTPVPLIVRIDGVDHGRSGVGTEAVFYLPYGFHKVEIIGTDGRVYQQPDVEIRKDRKVCICLKVVENVSYKPCPYRYRLERSADTVTEGDLVTFSAVPEIKSPFANKFEWRVENGRITSGQGFDKITVDSSGMGGRMIRAYLDVNDDVYDNRCRQMIDIPTTVEKIPPTPVPPKITAVECDTYQARTADEDKARFDNCVIQVQNIPDAQLYVIIYPGTDRLSTTKNTYDKLSKRTLDYLVKNRGLDPRRITLIKGSPRTSTSYEIWIVPPGADLPTPR